jgi:hypothetical protein
MPNLTNGSKPRTMVLKTTTTTTVKPKIEKKTTLSLQRA